VKTIPLTKGFSAQVDDEDLERVSQFKWSVFIDRGKHTVRYYAERWTTAKGKSVRVSLHRFILGLTDPKIGVDHKNHDGLDNQRHNLRIATNSQNQSNRRKILGSSKYKGVYWDKAHQRWRALIECRGKKYRLGDFRSELKAATAYNHAALRLFGEFACINEYEKH
jgi:hypothetical protein